jgi:hypothetical protein
MTNADWWARVFQARTQHDDLLPQRVGAKMIIGRQRFARCPASVPSLVLSVG